MMQYCARLFIASFVITSMVSSPLVVAAQVAGVSVSPGVITGAFKGTVEDTFQDGGDYVSSEIEDGISGGGTGNPIVDGATEGVAGIAAGALSCVAGSAFTSIAGQIASVPVADKSTNFNTGGNFAKECFLDQIGFQLKEALIKGMIKGMVTYINNGFSGGPGYMQNESTYFSNQRDKQFDEFINNPNNFSSLCSAWEADVRLALATQYTTAVAGKRVTQISGTGTGTNSPFNTGAPATCSVQAEGYASNDDDLSNRDYWGDFLARTTTTGGNALTSYFSLEEQFQENFEYNVEKTLRELDYGDGFFNVTYCEDGSEYYDEIPGQPVNTGKQNCVVTSPGSVISHQLNEALGSDLDRLEMADEFDEVFSALVGQLTKMVFSKLGLFGTTQRSGGSQSLIDQYAESTNPAVTASSREELLRQLNEYQGIAREHITFKERSLATLFDSREAIFDAMTCYQSKFNTWVYTANGEVVSADRLEFVSENERERATFQARIPVGTDDDGVVYTTAFLPPAESGNQVLAYEELLEEVNGYIFAIQDQIDLAQLQIDEAELLKIQLGDINNSDDPLSAALANSEVLKRISEEFRGQANTVTVALDDGTFVSIPQNLTTEQILEIYIVALEELTIFDNQAALEQAELLEQAVTDMLQGITLQNGERSPGVLADIEKCRAFSDIYVASDDDDDE